MTDLTTQPTDAAAWLLQAREHMREARYEQAVEAARSGLALDPDAEQRSALNLVIVEVRAGSDDDEVATALSDRGEALRSLGRVEQAEVEQSLGTAFFTFSTVLWTAGEEHLPALLETLAGAEDPAVRARLAITAGAVLLGLERAEEAVSLLESGIDDATAAGEDELAEQATQLLLVSGDFDL